MTAVSTAWPAIRPARITRARSSARSPLPSPQVPTPTRRAAGSAGDLVLRAHDRDLRVERLGERPRDDLRPDAARIAQCDRAHDAAREPSDRVDSPSPRAVIRYDRMSTYVDCRKRSM